MRARSPAPLSPPATSVASAMPRGSFIAALAILMPLAAHAGDPPGGLSAGIELRPGASTADLGLPVFPGASRRLDKDDSENGLTFAMWGGAYGFKLAVSKYASDQPIDRIAEFYRDALGRYGPVLDCSPPVAVPAVKDSTTLQCDDGKGEAGSRTFKVGTKKHQRIVTLRTRGAWVLFDMVRVDAGE